jgi:addiction module HigA family antidote
MTVAVLEKTNLAEHPGRMLSRKLEELDLADSEVADQAGISRPLMSQLTNGNRRFTMNSATKICAVIGGDPLDWLKRQREYDLELELKNPKPRRIVIHDDTGN